VFCKMNGAAKGGWNRAARSTPSLSGHGRRETYMAPEITGIMPFFIVRNVPAALAFYRDRLGFDVTFEGPEPNDVFFGIVQRGCAGIMFKDIGVAPVPNYTQDIKQGIARWDAYVQVPNPDALAAEFLSRNVELFVPLQDTDDGLRGLELKDADGYGSAVGGSSFDFSCAGLSCGLGDSLPPNKHLQLTAR